MRSDVILAAGYLEAGLPAAAADAAREIVARRPEDADAHYILGGALDRLGEAAEAIAELSRAAALAPADPAVRHALGLTLYRAGRAEEALADLRFAAEAGNPAFAESLGACLMTLSRPDEAEPFLARVAAARPGDALAGMNWGAALIDLNRCEEAIAACDRALALDPEHAEARMTRAIALLLAGRWAEAWPEYEARWRTRAFREAYPTPACPRWRGEALPPGSRLWVRGEQGYGDQIQFARFLAPAAARAGVPLAVSANAALHRLLRGLPGVEACVELAAAPEGCSAEIPMQSLAALFAPMPEAVPAAVPYLTPPALPALPPRRDGRLRLGVVWAGKPKPRDRAIAPALLAAALAGADAEIFSLQTGKPARARPPGWTDLAPQIHDFADTAALIAQMDAVVSVDTAVAHLAGALGVPVFVLLIAGADWRWLRGRGDTPWYPSARLLRQEKRGDWSAPLAALRAALQSM